MTVFTVSTTSAFDAAVKSAKGGDSILLSGTFDKLTLGTNFSSKVTIASADTGRPAVVNELITNKSGNVEFKNVKFEYKSGTGPVFIQNSSNITFNDVLVEGTVVGGYGQGVGVRVRDSRDFAIVNSDIVNLKNGFNFSNITDATIEDNNFRGMSNDGMIVGGLVNATITGNDFRDFKSRPADKHKDAIQINNGDGIAVSRDVRIHDNVIVNPEQSHGIFLGNKLASSGNTSAYYRDISIEGNYLSTAHKLGITVEHGWNVDIRNNTIVQNSDIFKGGNQINIPVINASSSSMYVTITGNKVASVPDPANKTWVVSGNSTGTKNLLHWDSDIRASSSALAAEPPEPATSQKSALPKSAEVANDPDDAAAGVAGVRAVVTAAGEARFNGAIAAQDARVAVEGFDPDRDVIVFSNFEANTFQGQRGGNLLAVFDGGKAVKIDNALDLQELVAMSDEVSASIRGDTLMITIEQDKGFAEFAFAGLADEFRAANHPEMF